MRVRLLITLILLLATQALIAQPVGSFRSRQNGVWNDYNTWERWDGTAWLAATTGQYPNDPAVDVTIQAHTVTVSTSAPIPPYSMRNLTVNAGGKLFANANVTGGGRYLSIFGTSLVNDGIIGNYPTGDDISLNIEGANVTISGASPATSFAVARLRKAYNASSGGVATTNLLINRSLYLTYNGGASGSTQLYNNITGTFNVTIASGASVTLTGAGNASIDGTSGADANSSRGTITVNGTLTVPGTLYLKTNNTGSPGNALVVGPSGIVNAATIDAAASGTAGHVLTLQENTTSGTGGKLNITGVNGFVNFSTTNNAYNLGTFYTMVEYSAVGNQNVRGELQYAKLTLSGSGNKILLANTTVNGNMVVDGANLDATASAKTLTLGSNFTMQNGATSTTNALDYLTVVTSGAGNQLIASNGQPLQAYAVLSTKSNGSLALTPGTTLRIRTDLSLNYTGLAVFSDGGNTIKVGDDALLGSNASTSSNFNFTGTMHFTFEGTTAADGAVLSSVSGTDIAVAALNNVLLDPIAGASQTQLTLQPFVSTQVLTIKSNLTVANTNALPQPAFLLNGNALRLGGGMTLYDGAGFQHGNGKVTFIGSANHAIVSPNAVDFYQFEVNATSVTTLSSDVVVDFQLLLTNGLVVTQSHEVRVAATASTAVTNASASSYVVGSLRRAVASSGSYDFPVGTLQNYELVHIDLNQSTGLSNLLAYFNAGLSSVMPDPSVTRINGTPITDLLNAGYWTVTPNAYTTVDYDITLYERGWTNFTGVPVQLGVVKRANAAWPWWGTNANGGPDGLQGVHDNATQSIASGVALAKRSHVKSLSDFAIGFGNVALPVTLTDFTADVADNRVELHWHTASELNNARFDVQRSADAVGFETIASVAGHGSTDKPNDYLVTDNRPIVGLNYYRLRQVDVDGRLSYSSVRTANVAKSIANALVVSPVPAVDVLRIDGVALPAEITVLDAVGKIVAFERFDETPSLLNVAQLAPGNYVVVVKSDGEWLRHRFTVQR